MLLLLFMYSPLCMLQAQSTGSLNTGHADITLSGEQKRWHPITLSVEGPTVGENDSTNPFSDYRLEATFTKGTATFVVPGYFAADGNAAETSAISGSVWRVHFTPDDIGTWNYSISMVTGPDVAISEDPGAVESVLIDNQTGSFSISETDKAGLDLRGKGHLRYVNAPYLRFDNGEWYIKSGIDSPENILAYSDFDGTYSLDPSSFIKDYDMHVQDWEPGNPSWQGIKGKGLVGAINYLASEGINSAFVLVNNLGVNDIDDEGNADVWPWTAHDVYDRYDVSKLAQWDLIFDYMKTKGFLIHFALQEIDNDVLLDNGDLGRTRKLFYRELVARFGYHNAVMWNIGEELRSDRNTEAQRKSYIDYIDELDPYDQPIVAHTWPGDSEYQAIYGPLLGDPAFNGISFQIHLGSEATGDLKVYNLTKTWYENAIESGRPWVIGMDECCGWKTGVRPWGEDYNLDNVRVDVLWGNLMAGGAGVEWFFGDRKPMQYDLATEDFRPYALMWSYTRHAMDLFRNRLPFYEMTPQTDLTDDEDHLVFAKPGHIYVIYLREGGSPILDVKGYTGTYRIKWYNPRMGGPLLHSTTTFIEGNGRLSLGSPPGSPEDDWVVLAERMLTPYASADFTAQIAGDNPLQVDFSGLPSSSSSGSIVSYAWDFGDGTSGSSSSVSHTYAKPGLYHPELIVSDNQGYTDSVGIALVVTGVDGTASSGLYGEYFGNTSLSGTPETRIDPRVLFSWGNGIPIRNIGEDNFSVRWTGYVLPAFSETYTFRLTVEDGGRLWIGDELLIDTWDTGGYSNTTATKTLQAGEYIPIQLEMVEETGRADIFLYWSSGSLPEEIIPEEHLFFSLDAQLPVELVSFDAILNGNDVNLFWETAGEQNNAGFALERAIDDGPFARIAFIEGQGTTTESLIYDISDPVPSEAQTLAYRLKQIDFDGTYAYYGPITLDVPVAGTVKLHTNYPNPFNPATFFQYSLPRDGHVKISVFDSAGREIQVLVDAKQSAGRHRVTFDGSDLASGLYFYRLVSGDFSRTRAMVLSK